MEGSLVSEQLVVQSHKGPYEVTFDDEALERLNQSVPSQAHFIVDSNVANLYSEQLNNVLSYPSVLRIEATEANKSLDKFSAYVLHLVSHGVRRGHMLIAIGGGIIQDITCFLGATLLRGIDWYFYPTTLLAQADSCIGSKSSINVGKLKNVLGTFTPPRQVTISTRVLTTLDEQAVRSGIGEMLKVHVIQGLEAFDEIAADYGRLATNPSVMRHYIYRSLEIKKAIIERDEFDRGIRNLMNYGHSFGHAIESAVDFTIPHGIAVTIGMDMANYVAMRYNLTSKELYAHMHPILATNCTGFERQDIPLDVFLIAISKDKKNTDAGLNLILPDRTGRLMRRVLPNDDLFRSICKDYLLGERWQ